MANVVALAASVITAFRRRRVATRVPPGTSSCVYEEPLEAVLSGPQLRFRAIQLPTPLLDEVQLPFDVLKRLSCELSLYLRILGLLEALAHETEGFLGLEHAAGCLLRRPKHLSQLRGRLSEERFGRAFVNRSRSRRAHSRLCITGLHG